MMESKLVSAGIQNLWSSFMGNSVAICFNKYALQIIEDPDIRKLYEFALQIAENGLQQVKVIFNALDFPHPIALNAADVNLNAPRLFSDNFFLYYINEMANHGLIGYALALSTSVGPQVRQININLLKAAAELYDISLELMQAKNIFDDFPQIPIPTKPEFAKKKSYLGSFFHEGRPLNIIEITSIYANLKKTILNKLKFRSTNLALKP